MRILNHAPSVVLQYKKYLDVTGCNVISVDMDFAGYVSGMTLLTLADWDIMPVHAVT